LADLNGDGRDEIVVISNRSPASFSSLVVYDAGGSILLQKILGNSSESSPILADVDGNGSIDVIAGGESGVVNAWNLAGQALDGFPLTVGDFVRGTPAFDDVNGDGGADLVLAGWNRQVYVWDLTGSYAASRAPWPTFGHDAARSGNGLLPTPVDTPEGAVPRPGTLSLGPNVPNPFNPFTKFGLDVPTSGEALVALYDGRGRLGRVVHQGPLAAGRHAFSWDGRDGAGATQPSGVYWCRASAGRASVTRKLTLLK
jgi:hypothetical protein